MMFERPYHRQTRPNVLGWLLMGFFVVALIFYIYVRAAKTLNLGAKYQWCAPKTPPSASLLRPLPVVRLTDRDAGLRWCKDFLRSPRLAPLPRLATEEAAHQC